MILLIRESPFSSIHLENMQRVTRAGGIIQTASPHFYTFGGQTPNLGDLIDSVVARTLDLLSVEHDLGKRWGEDKPHPLRGG